MGWIVQCFAVAMAMVTLVVAHLLTGAKVSVKSIPFFCSKPLTTNLAFLTKGAPSKPAFSLNTHLQFNAFFPGGSGSRV